MIPNIFHFCYGFLPGAQFGFLEYLAIKSAYEVNRPEQIYLHYQHECCGPWWEKAVEMVTLNRVEPPREIFGRRLHHFAHRSDVLRLMVLQARGGIYMDIDTLCLRPFSPLLDRRCVLAWQGSRGLCNAVILSEPGGEFVAAWLDSYRTFRSTGKDPFWDEHSVVVPGRLARQRQLRPHTTILGHSAFFPSWDDMRHLFESSDPAKFRDSYCLHYCESLTRERWLSRITPENALTGDSNFSRFTRRVLEGGSAEGNLDVEADRPSSGLLRGAVATLGTSLHKVRWIGSLGQGLRFLLKQSRDVVWLPRLVRSLGWAPAAAYIVHRLRLMAACRTQGPFVFLRSKRAAHPLRCRGFDDLAAFDRVFVLRQYERLDNAEGVGLIVDCGARVGYASACFLTRFLAARVIAIEPDPDNFSVLQANLAPYGERCQAVCAAMWPDPAGLVLEETTCGKGRGSRRQVRPARADEVSSVTALDLGTLLRESGFERISILRINIGGAESTLFASNCEPWIGKVDHLAVELHGDECRSALALAISADNFEVSESEGVMYCLARHGDETHRVYGLPKNSEQERQR